MTDDRPPPFRSCLYVPGHQPRRIEAAFGSGADAIILDLEDSVPWRHKESARERVALVLEHPLPKTTYVRINGVASGLALDDALAVASPNLRGIRVAKTRSDDDVLAVSALLDRIGSGAVLHPLLESAVAIENAHAIAHCSSRVVILGIGESDLQADLGVPGNSPTMDLARIRVVFASRAAGLLRPAQSVHTCMNDPVGLLRTTEDGKRLGFFGRMTIHPEQIPVINEIHTPSSREIREALAICEADRRADAQERSISLVRGGQLVGPPMVAAARDTLMTAEALDLIPGAR